LICLFQAGKSGFPEIPCISILNPDLYLYSLNLH
jgi:hypothetical protein